MWKLLRREYFAFPKKERRGLLVLFLIWISLLIYFIYISKEYENFGDELDYSIIVSEDLKIEDAKQLNTEYKYFSNKIYYTKYFKYLTAADINNFSLNKKQIETILKLHQNKYTIYTLSDLYKCDKLDTISKQYLAKNIKFFPEKKYFTSTLYQSSAFSKIIINAADTNEIDNLRGVSKGLSVRIFKYRERLGGFINHKQLKEVWGMDSSTYLKIIEQIDTSTYRINKININDADLDELAKHPYIGYRLAKVIVNYREQHGNFYKIEDLMKIHIMNADIFAKIERYITTSND